MDMYQKRKMRAENKKNKENNTEKGFANASFSWYSTNYLNTSRNC